MNLTKRLGAVGAFLALVLLTVLLGATRPAQAQGGGGTQGPFYGEPVTPVSMDKDLRTLPRTPQDKNKHGLPVLLPESLKNLPNTPAPPDPARQTETRPRLGIRAPSQSLNFDGAGGDDPPDDNGDIGRQYYVQTTNFRVAFFDKFTGNQVVNLSMDTFWSNAGGTGACNNNHNGDPIALYDTQADRYIVTDFAWSDFYNGPYYECIAVSKTSDPIAGGWWLYSFVADNNWLNDYPKLGVWPDAYYMMADMFDEDPGADPNTRSDDVETFKYVQVWALDRASMLSGGPLNNVSFTNASYFSMVPSNFKGTPPPAGRPNYFGVVDLSASSNKIHVFRFALNGAWPAPPATFTGPTDVTVTSFNAPTVNPPQLGSAANVLDTLGDRLMYQFQYRNIGGTESLWATQTVDAGGGTNGVRWYQLNVTGDVIAAAPVQQSTFSPDATHRWMPHLAANRFGDMALGYSASSSSINPQVRYTGRLVGDAVNTLQAEATLVSSGAAFVDCNPVSPATTCVSRWGDYSAMEVDPVDDCTFWYTNEYINGSGSAVTRIGSFRFSSTCAADLTITKTGPSGVIAGNQIPYSIHVINNGPVEATSVTMSDPLPAYLTFASLTAPAGWTCADPGVGNNGSITCTRLAMAVGEDAAFTLIANVSPSTPNNTVVTDTATATTTSSDPTTPNTASANTTVTTVADLATTKSHVVTGNAGAGQVTWKVTVTNNGPSDAQNVVMTDALDVTQTTFVSAVADNGGSCVYASPTVTCTWATVAAGVSVHVDIVADLLPNALHLCNTASATSDTDDTTPGNNTSPADCFAVPTLADVSVVKTAQVLPTGRIIRYTLVVHNAGPSYAQKVRVVDALADATTLESVTTTQGTCTNGQKVVCKLGVLTFTDVIIVIQVHVDTSVTGVNNTAKAKSVAGVDPPTPDPHKKNNKSKIHVVLGGN